jgi:histidine ammonia-lyase
MVGLDAEIRHLALPVSLGVCAMADGVEDHTGMALRAVEKAAQIVGYLRLLAAIELVIAAQALELRPVPLGAAMRRGCETVRRSFRCLKRIV